MSKRILRELSVTDVQQQADVYYGGFIARYVHKSFACTECIEAISSEEILPSHLYTSFREYDEQARLKYVTEDFAQYCGDVARVVFDTIGSQAHLQNVDTIMSEVIMATLPCPYKGCADHEQEFELKVVSFLVNISLHWYSKTFNDKLKQEQEKSAQRAARIRKIVGLRVRLVRKSLKFVRRKSL
jgi:hypothetical protein